MKTSRPSRRDSIYSAPVCGRVTSIWPIFSGRRAKATRSPPPLVFAIAALAAVAPDAFPPAVLIVFAIVTLPWNSSIVWLSSPFCLIREVMCGKRTGMLSSRGRPDKRAIAERIALVLQRPRCLRNPLYDGLELGKEFLAHLVARCPCAVRREIDGADRLAGAVENRDGNRAEPSLKFFVHNGKSLLAVGANAIEQRLHVGDRIRRIGFDGRRPEAAPDFRAVKTAELSAAERCVKGRQPAANRQGG